MDIIRLTKEMFETGKPFAQGELRIWMKEFAPKEILPDQSNLKEIDAVDGMMIVAHSESGNPHTIEVLDRPNKPYSKTAQRLIDQTNNLIAELQIHEESKLIHAGNDAIHKAYLLPPGSYIALTDAEYIDGAYKPVID